AVDESGALLADVERRDESHPELLLQQAAAAGKVVVRSHRREDDVVDLVLRDPGVRDRLCRRAGAEIARGGALLHVVPGLDAAPLPDPRVGGVHHAGELIVRDQVLAGDEAATDDPRAHQQTSGRAFLPESAEVVATKTPDASSRGPLLAGERAASWRDPMRARHGGARRVAAPLDHHAFGDAGAGGWCRPSPPPCSARASLRERRILPERSTETTFTSTTSPSLSTSSTFFTRLFARSEMCTSPSVPGKISTNAPNSMIRRTVPR